MRLQGQLAGRLIDATGYAPNPDEYPLRGTSRCRTNGMGRSRPAIMPIPVIPDRGVGGWAGIGLGAVGCHAAPGDDTELGGQLAVFKLLRDMAAAPGEAVEDEGSVG